MASLSFQLPISSFLAIQAFARWTRSMARWLVANALRRLDEVSPVAFVLYRSLSSWWIAVPPCTPGFRFVFVLPRHPFAGPAPEASE